MTLVRYPGTFRDSVGAEPIAIENDGQTLRVSIRGVAFEGRSFDLLSPVANADDALRAGFVLDGETLTAFAMTCVVPLPIVIASREETGVLTVGLAMAPPQPGARRDDLELRLVLEYSGGRLQSGGASGWFEDEMFELQRQLPDDGYFRACISCGLSDYSPYGHGVFGSLACFRDNKEAYRGVRSKLDLFRIWGSATEFVQETYVCPQFERRPPGTGYRG